MVRRNILIVLALLLIVTASYAVIKYKINAQYCNSCARCVNHCPHDAIYYSSTLHRYQINPDLCEGDGDCVRWCPRGAITQYNYVSNDDASVPQAEMSVTCYPNPVKSNSTISYNMSKQNATSTLTIYNVKGQEIKSFSIQESKGSIRWDRTDNHHHVVSSGTYYVKLSNGKETISHTVCVVK